VCGYIGIPEEERNRRELSSPEGKVGGEKDSNKSNDGDFISTTGIVYVGKARCRILGALTVQKGHAVGSYRITTGWIRVE
jgi:hypothetical protein